MATDSIWEDSYSPAADIIRSRAAKRAYYISIKETKLSGETARRNVLAGAIIDWGIIIMLGEYYVRTYLYY